MTAFILIITRYKLLYEDWPGYLIGGFALVWIANAYMSLFGRLRVEIRSERAAADVKAKEAQVKAKEIEHLETRQSGTRESLMIRSARSKAVAERARCCSAFRCVITSSVTNMSSTNAAVAGSMRNR